MITYRTASPLAPEPPTGVIVPINPVVAPTGPIQELIQEITPKSECDRTIKILLVVIGAYIAYRLFF